MIFSDHTTGQTHDAVIDKRPWERGQDDVLMTPFTAAFQGSVTCIDVRALRN